MSRPTEVREPFYFGQEGRRLFGCLHAAPRPRPGTPAVLICPSLGQQSMRSHRSLVQLAVRLSREGIPAMRFDYYGSGDSEGTLLDIRLDGLIADIQLATAEAMRRTRTPAVALVGLRIGAVAALRGGDNRIAGLALWDPLIDGSAFLEELARDHRAMLANSYVDVQRALPDGEIVERLGFRYPKPLLDEIAALNLIAQAGESALSFRGARSSCLVLDGGEDPDAEKLSAALTKSGLNSRFQRVTGPRVWSEEPYKGLIPAGALDALVGWADELAS